MTPIAQISLQLYVSLLGYWLESSDSHWLSVPCLLEYLRGHVAGRSTGSGKDMKLFLVHYSRQAKVCYQEICIVLGSSEEEILRFEVTMYNAMIVEVCDCGKSCTDEVGSVGLVVGTFATDTIE